MKTIVITGETGEGKTTELVRLIKYSVMTPISEPEYYTIGSILVVLPTKGRAEEFYKRHIDSHPLRDRVDVISVKELPKRLRGKHYNGILLDDYLEFPPLPDGDPLVIAAQRFPNLIAVTKLQSATLKVWKSNSVWYKPWTWGTGYYTSVIL